jgi:hypothetical protein
LKTSTYPNKNNVTCATIRSTNPTTKVAGIELGAKFALVHIDEPILDDEELVREVYDCKTIDDAFARGLLFAGSLVLASQLFSFHILQSYSCIFNNVTKRFNSILQIRKNDDRVALAVSGWIKNQIII